MNTTVPAPVPHFSDWRLATLAGRLKREMELPDGGRLLADALALAVLARLGAVPAPASRDRPLDEQRLRLAMERIAARPAVPPSIAELAAATGLTAAHFARAFRARTGMPPHAWIASLRVERALDALRRPGGARSLAVLAAEIGFADQVHMTREVRRATGLTPSVLRR